MKFPPKFLSLKKFFLLTGVQNWINNEFNDKISKWNLSQTVSRSFFNFKAKLVFLKDTGVVFPQLQNAFSPPDAESMRRRCGLEKWVTCIFSDAIESLLRNFSHCGELTKFEDLRHEKCGKCRTFSLFFYVQIFAELEKVMTNWFSSPIVTFYI